MRRGYVHKRLHKLSRLRYSWLLMDMQDVLSVGDAASALGVTPGRVRALIRDGRLPASKFAGRWVVLRADLALVQHRRPGRPSWTDVAAREQAPETGREG